MARTPAIHLRMIFGILSLFLSTELFGNDSQNENLLSVVYKNFKLEQYEQALINLEKISGSKKIEAAKAYFQGLCYNRLKKYDIGVKAYEKAKSLGHDVADIDYEMGQAYYATNHLENAILSFEKSVQKGFKVQSSLYYQAFSSQLLEEYINAKNYYTRLLKAPDLAPEMNQAANMQLGEIFLAMSEEKENQLLLVEKYVVPRFEMAIPANKNSPLVPEIEKRLTEIKRRFNLDPNVMLNDRILPEKRYTLSLTQKMSYDSNITLSTGMPTVQTAQKDAYIHESTAQGRYRLNFLRKITLTPDLRVTYKKHNDQDSSTVHQNDQFTTTGTIYNTYEHKFLGKMASLLVDYEHNLTDQDRTKTHKIEFFSYYDQGTLGEKAQFFSFGETGLRIKFKRLKTYSDTIDANTYTLASDQVVITPFGHMILGLLQIDYTRFSNNISQDTNSYMARIDYIIPEIYPKFMLNLAYSHTWLNPINQKLTRGVEMSYNPSLRLTRTVTSNLKATVSYSYTYKNSDDEDNFRYEKHVSGLDLRYDF